MSSKGIFIKEKNIYKALDRPKTENKFINLKNGYSLIINPFNVENKKKWLKIIII